MKLLTVFCIEIYIKFRTKMMFEKVILIKIDSDGQEIFQFFAKNARKIIFESF